MTGRWVDDVMIFHAVLFKIPFVASGGNDGTVCSRENAEVIVLCFRTLHCDAPFAAVRFCTDNLNISTEVNQSARHTAFPVNICDSAGRIALCDSAEIDFHTIFCKADGRFVFIVDNIVRVGEREKIFNHLIRRNRIVSGGKSPGVHERVDCDVKNTVRTVIQIQRTLQQIDGIF